MPKGFKIEHDELVLKLMQ